MIPHSSFSPPLTYPRRVNYFVREENEKIQHRADPDRTELVDREVGLDR